MKTHRVEVRIVDTWKLEIPEFLFRKPPEKQNANSKSAKIDFFQFFWSVSKNQNMAGELSFVAHIGLDAVKSVLYEDEVSITASFINGLSKQKNKNNIK
jgi:hypothetical protein